MKPQLYRCPRCHGIGEAKLLNHRGKQFKVCCYCQSASLFPTTEPIHVPDWFTGQPVQKEHWIKLTDNL